MFRTPLVIVFWLSFSLIIYVYLGYPLFLFFFGRPRCSLVVPEATNPYVTLLISAYNEAAVIGQKIKNSLDLDYPADRLQVIVISDASYDGTDEIVRSFSSKGVRLVRQTERQGKSAGLNLGFREATGEILVFSDANAIYQPDALRRIVAHFTEQMTGYVVGNARYTRDGAPSANSEGLYWKLEAWLKQRESNFGSVVGGDGAIYAIRRQLFKELRSTDINDLLHPLQIILRGYRGVYEPAAICYETAGDTFEKEFRRKVRIVSRSLNAVLRAWPVLLPWNQFRHWISIVSHKVLRWVTPFFLVPLIGSSILLASSTFYRTASALQLLFYALALMGWRLKDGPRLVYLPYYFCVVNAASFVGVLKALGGSLSSTWETIRNDETITEGPVTKRGF